jgi:hypothetical protein
MLAKSSRDLASDMSWKDHAVNRLEPSSYHPFNGRRPGYTSETRFAPPKLSQPSARHKIEIGNSRIP